MNLEGKKLHAFDMLRSLDWRPYLSKTRRRSTEDRKSALLIWVAYGVVGNSTFPLDERLTCPLLNCRQRLENLEEALSHIQLCIDSEENRYWCPRHRVQESISARKLSDAMPSKIMRKLKRIGYLEPDKKPKLEPSEHESLPSIRVELDGQPVQEVDPTLPSLVGYTPDYLTSEHHISGFSYTHLISPLERSSEWLFPISSYEASDQEYVPGERDDDFSSFLMQLDELPGSEYGGFDIQPNSRETQPNDDSGEEEGLRDGYGNNGANRDPTIAIPSDRFERDHVLAGEMSKGAQTCESWHDCDGSRFSTRHHGAKSRRAFLDDICEISDIFHDQAVRLLKKGAQFDNTQSRLSSSFPSTSESLLRQALLALRHVFRGHLPSTPVDLYSIIHLACTSAIIWKEYPPSQVFGFGSSEAVRWSSIIQSEHERDVFKKFSRNMWRLEWVSDDLTSGLSPTVQPKHQLLKNFGRSSSTTDDLGINLEAPNNLESFKQSWTVQMCERFLDCTNSCFCLVK